METISTIVGMVIVFVGKHFFDDWADKRKEERKLKERPIMLDKNSKIMQSISACLIRLQAYTGCSRAAIFEYSNGNYTHANISMQYIDCTYEVTDETTMPIINNFKRVSIAPYLNQVLLIGKGDGGFARVTDHDEDKEIRTMQQYWNTSTAYNFRITDVVWDGVVGLSWIGKDVVLSQDELDHINIEVLRIKDLMNQLKNNYGKENRN